MKNQNDKFELVTKVPYERRQQYINAIFSGKVSSLDTAPSKKLNLPTKQVTLESFFEINKNSQLQSYNRTFIPRRFRRAVEKANRVNKTEAMSLCLVVEPLMTHNYRQMSECETHYRCKITYSEFGAALFDMTIADYEKLELVEESKKSA
ncbi:hypothetical protein OAE55_06955 [Gammaproteobacteria bacterium]|nr:hypothetical protein [Gammaproteobacteria bacterium]